MYQFIGPQFLRGGHYFKGMGGFFKGNVLQAKPDSIGLEWTGVTPWKGNEIKYSMLDEIDAQLDTSRFHFSLPVFGNEPYRVDGKAFLAQEGDYFLFHPGQEARAEGVFKETVKGFCIFIDEETIAEAALGMQLPISSSLDAPFHYPWQQHEFCVKTYSLQENLLGQYLSRIKQVLLGEAGDVLVDWDVFYYELATAFLRAHRQINHHLGNIPSVRTFTRHEIYRRLTLVHNYILAHYDQALTLDELQKIGLLSKFHLVRLYRQVYGNTPYQAILSERVKKAKELLKLEYSPTIIANELSFSDRRAFSKVFKKMVGVAPSLYVQQQSKA